MQLTQINPRMIECLLDIGVRDDSSAYIAIKAVLIENAADKIASRLIYFLQRPFV